MSGRRKVNCTFKGGTKVCDHVDCNLYWDLTKVITRTLPIIVGRRDLSGHTDEEFVRLIEGSGLNSLFEIIDRYQSIKANEVGGEE